MVGPQPTAQDQAVARIASEVRRRAGPDRADAQSPWNLAVQLVRGKASREAIVKSLETIPHEDGLERTLLSVQT